MAKRLFDIVVSLFSMLLFGWVIALFYIWASIDTAQNGMFIQMRVGQYGKLFKIYKLKTMTRDTEGKSKISALGRFLRKYKVDELPQLYNILKGDMSFVGPRPDIPGYYDKLTGEERQLLNLKPGLTGPANIKYWNEEQLLLLQPNPDKYNDDVLFPDKVKINMQYMAERTFWFDIKIIIYTLLRKNL
ncbi:sugar transferase [Flavobacterium rivuli WB 3.3-2 = DSM 21788]|uniref:Sugar transferase n=1 Tax=Flavobacterium rivuli WB 3.3-2 = DSM 21788 TaxID=1121895 RepID=A0A0A2M474_9FLAO|nr:sugar transferase [Flavobacterium rivuli]KGO87457.1 sugar transferase [Flavobacterium rivuli WB 3.3-2 = DSM 21788]